MPRRSSRLMTKGYCDVYKETPVKVFKNRVMPSRKVVKFADSHTIADSLRSIDRISSSPGRQASSSLSVVDRTSTMSTITQNPMRGQMASHFCLETRVTIPPSNMSICNSLASNPRESQQRYLSRERFLSSTNYPTTNTSYPSTSSNYAPSGYVGKKGSALFTRVKPLSQFKNLLSCSHKAKTFGLILLVLIGLNCYWLPFPSLCFFPQMYSMLRTKIADLTCFCPALNKVFRTHEADFERVQSQSQHMQEHNLPQIGDTLQQKIQEFQCKLHASNQDSLLYLEEIAKQVGCYETKSKATMDNLNCMINKLEAQNTKLSQVETYPETSSSPGHNHISPGLRQALLKWITDKITLQNGGCVRPIADSMKDFALKSANAHVVHCLCSDTYRVQALCIRMLGFSFWCRHEDPDTVIEGHPMLFPGKCWPFPGQQGTLVISLANPVKITHVTLDHLPVCLSPTGEISSAPRNFEIYGMATSGDVGKLLGSFTYDKNGESTQTFKLPNSYHNAYKLVKLHVLTNWGNNDYTCLYRFRVHGKENTCA